MILGNKKNQAQILAFIPTMKANMHEWQIISVKFPNRSKETQTVIIGELMKLYKDKEGIIFPVSDYKVVLVVHLGLINNYALLKSEFEDQMHTHSCRVIARKMSPVGLKQVQIDLSFKDEETDLSMYEERERRKKNVFLVADDDMFVRKTLSKLLSVYGEVIEVESGGSVKPSYLEHNPDIVFLDIHMPGQSGLEIVNSLIDIDTDAFLIMISADSSRENVLEAVSCGAVGFLSKPLIKEKVREYLSQCITFQVNSPGYTGTHN